MSTNQNNSKKDIFFMNLALHQAKRSLGNTKGNPAVGCVIVKNNTLIGVSGITKKPPVGAIIIERDNLQDIKGVGPFIEEKLNALGIYTFKQIANMNFEIEEQVNVAIEFFPGRIRRDEWAKQAYDFITDDES